MRPNCIQVLRVVSRIRLQSRQDSTKRRAFQMLRLNIIIGNIVFKVSLKVRFNKSEQTNSQRRVILRVSSWAPCRFSFVKA